MWETTADKAQLLAQDFKTAWAGFGHYSPQAAAVAGIAALALPALISNKDRGYARSSALTTPLVAAGFIAAPHLYHASNTAINQFSGFWREKPFVFQKSWSRPVAWKSYKEMVEMTDRQGSFSSRIFQNAMADMGEEFYSGLTRQDFDANAVYGDIHSMLDRFSTERDQLKTRFRESMDSSRWGTGEYQESLAAILAHNEQHRTLQYASEEARISGLAPSALSTEAGLKEAPARSIQQIRDLVDANRTNPIFLRRMQMGAGQSIKGGLRTGKVFGGVTVGERRGLLKMNMDEALGTAGVSFPQNWDSVESHIRQAQRNKLVDHAQLVFEEMKNSKGGVDLRAIGAELTNAKGELLSIPFTSGQSGMTHFGSGWRQTGIAGKVFNVVNGQAQLHELDEYAFSHLGSDWEGSKGLKAVLAKALPHGGHTSASVSDEWMHADYKNAVLDDWQQRMVRRAVGTPLDEFDGAGWEKLTSQQKMSAYRQMDELGYTKIGSQGTFNDPVLESKTLRHLTPGGLPTASDASLEYRSLSKPIHMDMEAAAAHKQLRLGSTFAAEELGTTSLPEVQALYIGVSPAEKMMFGAIPEGAEEMIRKAASNKNQENWKTEAMAWMDKNFQDNARKYIAKDMNMSEESDIVQRVFREQKMRWMHDPESLIGLRRLGHLGETSGLASPDLSDLGVTMRRTVEVDHFHLNPYDYQTQPIPEDMVIGTNDLGPVRHRGEARIENVFEYSHVGADGQSQTKYKAVLSERFTSGEKAEWANMRAKGWKMNLAQEEDENIVKALNTHRHLTDRPLIPETGAHVFLQQDYGLIKEGNSAATLMENALEISQALVASDPEKTRYGAGFHEGVQKFLDKMVTQHQYMWKADGSGLNEDYRAMQNWNYTQSGERFSQVHAGAADFLNEIGGNSTLDHPVLNAYRNSKTSGSLVNYLESTARYGPLRTWSTAEVNAPKEVRATWDLLNEMHRSRAIDATADIKSRLQHIHGDQGMGLDMMRHLAKGQFDEKIGEAVPLNDLKSPDSYRSLNNLEARMGKSPFNPEWDVAKKNMSIDLGAEFSVDWGGQETKLRYLPKLGTEAFGGGGNRAGMSIYGTDLEKSLHTVMQEAYGRDWSKTDPKGAEGRRVKEALQQYLQELSESLVGKKGVLRDKGIVNNAAIGFYASRMTTADGTDSKIFDVFLSKNLLNRFDDPTRRAIMSEDGAYGTFMRHPISAAPFVRLRYSEEAKLDPNMIGASEFTRSLSNADDDQDIASVIAYTPGSKASEEARAAIADKKSVQWRYHQANQIFQGELESSSAMHAGMIEEELTKKGFSGKKSLFNSLSEDLATHARGGSADPVFESRMKSFEDRLAGAYTGQYSNLATRMQRWMSTNPNMTAGDEDYALMSQLVWYPRQITISAQKGKMKLPGGDPGKFLNQMTSAIDNRDANALQSMMVDYSLGNGFEGVYGQTHADAGITHAVVSKDGRAVRNADNSYQFRKLQFGETYSASASYAASDRGRSAVEKFLSNPNGAQADAITRLQVANKINAKEAIRLTNQINLGLAGPELEAIGSARQASSESSRALGAMNQFLRESASEIGRAVKPGLPVLGLGLGAAAVAGLFSTSISRSGNQYRAEENIATADMVPGEPISGARSPSNPKRRMTAAPAQTRTALVVPVQQSMDLEVQMQGEDRSKSADAARAAVKLASSGHTNVTINHSGGWKESASKLRNRQKIREAIDQ